MKLMLYACLFIIAFQCHAQITDFKAVNFQKADRIALECKNDGLENLPALVYKLTSQLSTDVERFRAIYRWVSGNIANDYQLYHKNLRKRQRYKNNPHKLQEWNKKFRKLSIQKLLKNQKTICTGYAYLIKKMSDLADIDCEVVHGFARTSTINPETLDMPNHSWNAVKLNDKWYLCDPTWASGIPNNSTFIFEFDYNDGFFLPNPELFAINHYPEKSEWLLLDKNATTFESFLESPVFYGNTYKYLSTYESPKKLHNAIQKDEIVLFKCQLSKPIDREDIILVLDSGSTSHKIHPKNITIEENNLTIEHSFSSNGFYDVHLYFGEALIASYTFRVKN